MDEKSSDKEEVIADIQQFEREIEPVVLAVTMGDFSTYYDIPIFKGSKLETLQASTRLLVDGFYEQWLEMNAAREKLENMNRELQLTLSRLEQFTYVASHELRVPLVNLKQLIDLNKVMPSDTVQNHIEKSVEKFDDTLKELILTISESSLPQKNEYFHVGDFLAHCADEFIVNPKPKLTIAHADIVLFIDRSLFKKVMKQIMLNSTNFRDKDRILEIDIKVIDNETNYTIEYSDNSSGINLPAETEILFGLFKTGTHPNVGRGIGMHLVKNILGTLNGEITAQGAVGQGINYIITIKK